MTSNEKPDEPWNKIHRDYKGIIDGKRFIMARDEKTGGSILRPWRDPSPKIAKGKLS
jgi:hypothetical protein